MNSIQNDKRIIEAKKLVLSALSDHMKEVSALKSPTSDHQALCSALEKIRGFPLYYPFIGSGFGSGPYVELADGSVKLDMISGIGPNLLGHNHLGLASALFDACLADTVMQGNLMHNVDAVQLAQKLVELSGFDHCFLSTSGAMACENALKIIFQHYAPATRILAFEHCFIGRTIALSQITDKPSYRIGVPELLSVDYIPFYNHKRPVESTQETLSALKTFTDRYPGKHACLCIELIQGEGGIVEGSSEYFHAIIEFLRSKNIGVYVDEVQTFGRTESLFAHHLYGLKGKVDAISIGKVSQTCATLFSKEVAPKPGLLSQTFTGSTAGIRAALWFLEHLDELNLYGHEGAIARLSKYFHEALNKLNKKIPGSAVGPYGRGALLAFTPFDWDLKKVTSFLKRLYANGVIAFQAGSHTARVRMLPPFGAMEEKHIDEVMAIVEKTIREEMA